MSADEPTLRPEDLAAASPVKPGEGSPRQVGPYQLLQNIGEGAFGEVWLAQQTEPVRRRVAVKIIKLGMDSREVIARFEAERQAVAMMNHPAVAKVFDAGTTPSGRPYFVMEYVEGVPITEHCDRQQLTTRERLELFVQVCEGVQHAHQKAILHRDLKPSNILVSVQDGRAMPKIIDFGVAKAMAQKLTDKSMYTQVGVLIGTPTYMSPEQADPARQDVDTRTDVYSLGVLLYELVVGELPFEMGESEFHEILRKIRDEEPRRPSTRVSMSGQEAAGVASRRRTTLPALRKELRGDLDWITMKALEKDRTRRYGSPQELAADLGRHLRHQPVVACPPGVAYRTRKFVRRHRVGVTAGSLVVLALVAGMAAAAFGLVRAWRAETDARREAETSARVSQFLADMLGEVNAERMGRRLLEDLRRRVADAQQGRGATESEVAAAVAALEVSLQGVNSTDLALRMIDQEILERAGATLDTEFAQEPRIEAQLRQTIADTYFWLGLYEAAERHAKHALEIRQRLLGEDHPDTLRSKLNLARLHSYQGRYDEAEQIHHEAMGAMRRVLGGDHEETLGALNNLASVYAGQGRYEEAEILFREVLDAQRRVLGDDHEHTLNSMTNLASAILIQGRYDDAEVLYRQTLDASRRVLGEDDPNTVALMANLADTYHQQGRHAEAESLNQETLQAARRIFGDDHLLTLFTMTSLAVVYAHEARYDEAKALLREAVERQRVVVGEEHPATLRSLNALGDVYRREGRHDQAAVVLQRVLETRHRILGDAHPDIGESLHALGCLAAARGDGRRAVDLLRQAIDRGWVRQTLLDDPDLASLRGDPEFQAMVDEVRKQLGFEGPGLLVRNQ